MIVSTLFASMMFVALQPLSQLPPGAVIGGESSASPHVLYRWLDPQNQINYGDRPPPNARNIIKIDMMTIGEHTQSLLPYLVRRASQSFPVMLFTAKNCAPCVTARNFLNKRGIPFAERTIESGDDSMEFKRLTGAEGVPVVLLGKQPLIAFDPEEWNSALDSTGYPKASQLPPTFKQEAARPLTQKATPPPATPPPAAQ
jgi:glutaredoxin